MLKFLRSGVLNIIDFMTEARRQNGVIKYM